ncbi:MAG: hypothetical protein DRH24_12015 [Deltaproteobacteria bacterium]|nr:MAG: hypothetical protein DRH24_12015 [Deltaproteobacteria bacterium]
MTNFLEMDGAPPITEPDSANARTAFRNLNIELLNLANQIAKLNPPTRAQFLARFTWATVKFAETNNQQMED